VCIAQQKIGGLAPDQRIVNTRECLAVADRRRQTSAIAEVLDELIKEAMHDLIRPRVRVIRSFVHSAYSARQTSYCTAAAEAITFEQNDPEPLARHCAALVYNGARLVACLPQTLSCE
jgi:hypothetical protein